MEGLTMDRTHILVHFTTDKITPTITFKGPGDDSPLEDRPFHLRLGDVSTWLNIEEMDALLYEANAAMYAYDQATFIDKLTEKDAQ
jgi:hypothetical protein